MGSSQALSKTREEWSIHCRKGWKLGLGLSSLVCMLTIVSANLRDSLILNTIQGGALHASSCKNAACTMSYNTMNKIESIPNA